jgi:hypothetical protein
MNYSLTYLAYKPSVTAPQVAQTIVPKALMMASVKSVTLTV